MSYRNRRLMPHPVLSRDRDDYREECRFSADVASQLSSGGRDVTISVSYQLQRAETLTEMIQRGQAKYCAVTECSKTYRRTGHETRNRTDLITLKREEYTGELELTPYVAAAAETENFNPGELDEEVRRMLPPEGLTIPQGAILAIGDPVRIPLEPEGQVDSIIDLSSDGTVGKGQYLVDLSSERIIIYVHPDVYQRIQAQRNQREKHPILNQALYVHAVDKAIRNLAEGKGKGWANTIAKQLEENRIDPEDEENLQENSETHAQTIFGNPLEQMLKTIERADDRE